MDHDRVEPNNQEQGQKVAENKEENLKDILINAMINDIPVVDDAKWQG